MKANRSEFQGTSLIANNESQKEISERLKEVILYSGYSFAELQKITGVSKSALQRYAQGKTEKIPVNVISKIASATGVSPVYLAGWCNDPNYIINSNNLEENALLKK